MENRQILFKSLGILLLLACVLSCSVLQNAIQRPTVQVENVSYHPVSLREGRLDSRLRISNPNHFALPLRTVTYRLKLNGRVFADSKLSFSKDIPAQGTLELQVPIHFRYDELLQGLSSLLVQHDIRFQIAGKLDLGLLEIPFSKSGEFALQR